MSPLHEGLTLRFGGANLAVVGGTGAPQRQPVWHIGDADGLEGVTYGPLTHQEASLLVRALGEGQQPKAPEVPWFAAARSPRGEFLVATSTLFESGVFWARVSGGVVVGTDPYSCLQASGQSQTFDAEYLRQFALGRPPERRTPYVGVSRSSAGVTLQWLTPHISTPVVIDWASPHNFAQPDLSGDDAVVAYLEAFDAACETLLSRCGVPSVAMSSGLDSTFIVGSLAQLSPREEPIDAYVYRPVAAAALPQEGVGCWDEGPLADAMAHSYPGRVVVHHVVNHQGKRPLVAASEAAQRSGLPAANPANQVWLTGIRQMAIAAGATMWFMGTNGNAAFSRRIPYASHRGSLKAADLRRRFLGLRRTMLRRSSRASTAAPSGFLQQFGLGELKPSVATATREGFLMWLARRGNSRDAAANPAATEGCLRVDPFASRPILEIAARITDDTWRFGGQGRGFARRLGEGRVPDAIRFSKIRGSQGRDAWFVIRNDRDDYLRRVQLARDVPGLESLNVDKLVAHISTWPWGQVNGPPWHHQVALDRLLSVVDFAHARGAL